MAKLGCGLLEAEQTPPVESARSAPVETRGVGVLCTWPAGWLASWSGPFRRRGRAKSLWAPAMFSAPPPGKGSTPPHSPGGLVTRSPSLRFPGDCVRDVTTSSCLLLCALGMPESERGSILRFGLGGGWRDGRGLYYGEPPRSGAPHTCQEGKSKRKFFSRCRERGCIPNALHPCF